MDTWTESLCEATQLTLVDHDNYNNMMDVLRPDFPSPSNYLAHAVLTIVK